MALSACVDSFILSILCGNPILKGAFVSFLNTLVIQIDEEITVTTAQLGRLNLVNKVLSLEIQGVKAILDKAQADLNLVLGPLSQFPNCPELSNLNQSIQNTAVSKTFIGLQNQLYSFNRIANIANLQNSIIQQKEKLKSDVQAVIARIALLCP